MAEEAGAVPEEAGAVPEEAGAVPERAGAVPEEAGAVPEEHSGADDVPDDLLYSADHEWVRDLGTGTVRVGVTNFAQDSLGDIVFVQLPTVGDAVTAGSAVGELESTKSVSDLLSPVTGRVTAVNDLLDATPELVNSDPYGGGWMIEVETADLPVDLLDPAGYRESTQ